LHIFGCLCYSSTFVAHRKKLDSRVVPCVFLGFKPHTKGFIFLNLKSHKIEISRNLIFYKSCFPYLLKNEEDPNSLSLPIPQHYAQTYDDINMHNDHGSPHKNDDDLCVDNNDVPTATLRRSDRNRRIPIYLQDFQTSSNQVSTKYPIQTFINFNSLSSNFRHTIMFISSHDEPQNYEAVIQNPLWVQATQNELAALAANQTWSITDLPPGKYTIGCRWVYKIKYHSNGTIEQYKARLVAKGYNQMEG